VKVIAGKDKGKTGTVLHAHPSTDQVTIEDINVVKRHQKNKRTRAAGQIVEISKPVHVSNVALMEGDKTVRVGYEIKDGKKTRISRASGKAI